MPDIMPAVQPGLFLELVETLVMRGRVTDEGVFLSSPPGCGWRVIDAHRERHTTWQRRRPVVRIWKKQRK